MSILLSLTFLGLVAQSAAAGSGSSHGSAKEGPTPADLINIKVEKWLAITWAALIAMILIYRLVRMTIRYIRTMACIGTDKQRIFQEPNSKFAMFKRYLLDAPLFRKRHHREFMLSTAINVGTLPNRLQFMFLAGYLGLNAAFCVVYIDYSGTQDELADEIRNRTGTLAVMNMIPLFLLAGRNNPLIGMLDISYDTYNLMHRWIGRIVVLEAIAHTLAWMVNKVMEAGWKVVAKSMASSNLILTGTIVSHLHAFK